MVDWNSALRVVENRRHHSSTSVSAALNGIGYSGRVDGQRRHSRNIDTPVTGGNGWVRQVLGEAQQATEWSPGVHVIVL